MSLLSLIVAFLIEQLQPLPYRRWIEAPLAAWADWVAHRFNAGSYRDGIAAWLVAAVPLTLLVAGAYALLYWGHPLLALVFNVGVLYLTMGFRQFSHHYTEIQLALRLNDLPRARQLLVEWQGMATERLNGGEIARLSIEAALAASHRHVFAVLLWFVILPGPCGAVLYRCAAIVAQRWRVCPTDSRDSDFFKFSQQVFRIIDWLPLRATASAFAVVGDFEDAVYCWRTQAGRWRDGEAGIVLASGAGALGVQLGLPVAEGEEGQTSSELGLGEPADVDFMQSAVGLVWRAAILWMLLLFLLGLASLVG